MLGLTPKDECTIGRVLLFLGGSGAALALVTALFAMEYQAVIALSFGLLAAIGGMLVHEYCPSVPPTQTPPVTP